MSGPVHPVRENEILPPVPIVIDERDSRTECFGKILLAEGTGVMHERETRGLRHICELNRGLRVLAEYGNRDGTTKTQRGEATE